MLNYPTVSALRMQNFSDIVQGEHAEIWVWWEVG